MKNQNTNILTQNNTTEASRVVKLGMDVHAKTISVVRIFGSGSAEPAQSFSYEKLIRWVKTKHLDNGWEVYACYEAGPTGFGLQRQLERLGVSCHVVQPRKWDEYGRGVKTDALDAKALAMRLSAYVDGNKDALALVRIPSVEEELLKDQSRQRERLRKNRQQLAAYGCSLLLKHGYSEGCGWWKPRKWKCLQQSIDEETLAMLRIYHKAVMDLKDAEDALIEQMEQRAPEKLPKGLGRLTFVTLLCEIGDWNRFNNRKQVAAFTGLCPRESSSGKKKRYGHISKHGNPRIRAVLVELAWRLVRWQPDSRLVQKHKDKLVQGAFSGNKKKAIIAISRQLSIDLWRLFTEQTTMEELGFIAAN